MKVKIFSTRPYEENYLKAANVKGFEVNFEFTSLSIDHTDLSKGYEAISVFANDDLSSKVLEQIKSNGVKYIAIRATGYDQVDLSCASRLGLKVANVPEYSPYSVAEHALALMLALNRKLVVADRQVKQFDFTLNNLIGFDMNGKTVGIIGMGKIGKTLAKILSGFGCKILAFDLIHDPSMIEKYGVTYCSKEELFSQSDIISFHCPLNTSSKYLLNKESIEQMKDGVMLINCGRGGLIDTQAIIIRNRVLYN